MKWNLERWKEEARVQRAIGRLKKEKPKLHKDTAQKMVEFWWEDMLVNKDSLSTQFMKRYGYFEEVEV